MKKLNLLLAICGLALGALPTQTAWASVCSATPNPDCILGSVVYFTGGWSYDLKYQGYPANTLSGALSDNLGDGSGLYIDDDYSYGNNLAALKNTGWNVTGVNAWFLGTTPSEISLTKYGSRIGIDGYAELANLAEELYLYSGKDGVKNKLTAPFVYAGYTFATGTTYPAVTRILNEAIYAIQSNTTLSGATSDVIAANHIAAYLRTHIGAEGSSYTSSALTELKSDYDIWFLNGGSNKPEFILQYTVVPEGISALAGLLIGGLFCMGAVVFARRQENNQAA